MAEYTLPDLPYDYGALAPHIAPEIMELHHSKHHNTCVQGLNATIDKLCSVLSACAGQSTAAIIGRRVRLGPLEAPVANGQMGHVLDYDDTHMGGVVLHTSSPVLSARQAFE